MKHRILSGVVGLLLRYRRIAFLIVIILALVSLWTATGLRINSNQITLLPKELPAVRTFYRVKEMTGGVGFLTLALKSEDDPKQLKAVADHLAEEITELEGVRFVTYKTDTAFVRRNIAMFLEPPDLKEVRRRIRDKIKEKRRKANPFSMSLSKKEEKPLQLEDIVRKYRNMGKKGIDDDYYISRDKQMLLLLIRPYTSAYDLNATRSLLRRIEGKIAAFNEKNQIGARLAEVYGHDTFPDPPATIGYGWSGHYKTTLDDSDIVAQSLGPTSAIAFVGVFCILTFFLRRLFPVALLMLSLVTGILYAFFLCAITVGELNIISTMLGSILLGLGIDYGIHYIYRLREEYTRLRGKLKAAARRALVQTGAASMTSAVSTSAALFTLCISDFRGFSDFGFVAGFGILIIASMMFVLPTLVLLAVNTLNPGFVDRQLSVSSMEKVVQDEEETGGRPFGHVGLILTMTLLLVGVFGYSAYAHTAFDYDARSLMMAEQPSVVLQEEIRDRFRISSSPAGIATTDLEETWHLYRELVPAVAVDISLRGDAIRPEALLSIPGAFQYDEAPPRLSGTKRYYVVCESHVEPGAELVEAARRRDMSLTLLERESGIREGHLVPEAEGADPEDVLNELRALKGIEAVRNLGPLEEKGWRLRIDLARLPDPEPAARKIAAENGWEVADLLVERRRLNRVRYNTFDAAISLYSFYPPHDWQVQNARTLKKMRRDAKKVRIDYLEDLVVTLELQGPANMEEALEELEGVKEISSVSRREDDPVEALYGMIENRSGILSNLLKSELESFLFRRGPREARKPEPTDIETFRIAFRMAEDPRQTLVEAFKERDLALAEMPMEGTEVIVRVEDASGLQELIEETPGVIGVTDQGVKSIPVRRGERKDIRTFRVDCRPLPPPGERIRELIGDRPWEIRELTVTRERELFRRYLDLLKVEPFTLDELPTIYKKQFRNIPESRVKGYLTFIYPRVALWDGRDLLAFADNVEVIEAPEETFYATGSAVVFAHLARIVLEDGVWFTSLAAILILFILLVDFRSLISSLVALIPLFFSMLWLLGLLPIVGFRLNFFNILVLPIILGYGVDNGIHIFHRFRESGSVHRAVRVTGRAVVASSFTTIVGWGALITTYHRGLRSMGTVACLGIFLALVASLTVMPAILQVISNLRSRDHA